MAYVTPIAECVGRLPPKHRDMYSRDFSVADEGFLTGRVETHSKNRSHHWQNWCAYVRPLGVDPYLKHSEYGERSRILSGYAARVRTGYYGRGKQIKATTVSLAITAVGQTICLECETNHTKLSGSEKLIPCLQQMLDGWKKVDPPTLKIAGGINVPLFVT